VSELEAFHAFRENYGLIRCLGDYSTEEDDPRGIGRTFNILLEYGELDLDEFFASYQPPVLPTEIAEFWRNLSVIADVIRRIHMFERSRGGVHQTFRG
jgi:hypothetical protein